MGQIANDIVSGFQCSWCGVCFENEHGYPVACKDCWREAMKNPQNRKKFEKTKTIDGIQKATHPEL